MKYILKIYNISKYFGYEKITYKEFNTYDDVIIDLIINAKLYNSYEIYEKKEDLLWRVEEVKEKNNTT